MFCEYLKVHFLYRLCYELYSIFMKSVEANFSLHLSQWIYLNSIVG